MSDHEPIVVASTAGRVEAVTCTCGAGVWPSVEAWSVHKHEVEPDKLTFQYFACNQCGSTLTGPHPSFHVPPRELGDVSPGVTAPEVTWTSLDCPNHGPVVVMADGGELDIGITE